MFNSKSVLFVLLMVCFATVLFAQNVSTQEAMEFEKINQQDLVAAQKLFEKLEGITGDKTVETVLEPLNDLQIILDRTSRTLPYSNNSVKNRDTQIQFQWMLNPFIRSLKRQLKEISQSWTISSKV